MPALQSCYFCGAPEDLGEYAAVPPRYADGDDPRRVVLCSDCRRKLRTVIEPLAERLDRAVDGEGGPDADADDGASDPGDAPASTDPPTTDDAAGEPDPSDDGVTFPSGGRDADPAADDPLAGGRDAPDDGSDGSAARDAGDAASTGAGDPASTEGDDPASTDATDDDGASDADGPPEGARTVRRLLSNREFPVERAAVAAVARNAYDMSDAAVERALDHVVETGPFVADGDSIRRA